MKIPPFPTWIQTHICVDLNFFPAFWFGCWSIYILLHLVWESPYNFFFCLLYGFQAKAKYGSLLLLILFLFSSSYIERFIAAGCVLFSALNSEQEVNHYHVVNSRPLIGCSVDHTKTALATLRKKYP